VRKEFEQILSSVSLVFVKFIRQIMVLAVMGAWLLAVNHCSLENIPALKFLACADYGATQPHQENDCEKDSCATVEKASYKTESGKVAAPAPMVLLAIALVPATEEEAEPGFHFFAGVIPALVPELPVAWQFSYRTAAPPRAPSIVS
jgi:hypothetical protein